MWTRFMDMSSGGGRKEQDYRYIYIEAPSEEAIIIFYNRFKHNPLRVTCGCCGQDYSIDESGKTLIEATAHERGCAYAYFNKDGTEVPQDEAWIRGDGLQQGYTEGYIERRGDKYKDYVDLADYMKEEYVLFVHAEDIDPEERTGEVPEEGYV